MIMMILVVLYLFPTTISTFSVKNTLAVTNAIIFVFSGSEKNAIENILFIVNFNFYIIFINYFDIFLHAFKKKESS